MTSATTNASADLDYRQAMRDFVIGISQYAKPAKPDFAIVPQNGIELVSTTGEPDGKPAQAYLAAIDGHGQEDLFYGYEEGDQATSDEASFWLEGFLDLSQRAGNIILVTDYCSSPGKRELLVPHQPGKIRHQSCVYQGCNRD